MYRVTFPDILMVTFGLGFCAFGLLSMGKALL